MAILYDLTWKEVHDRLLSEKAGFKTAPAV